MITLDGKEYKEEDLSKEQKQIAQILVSLANQKSSVQLQFEQLNILTDYYIQKFKDSEEKSEESSKKD
jgi:uncharacterized coiled-coil protein SlyX